MVEFGRFGNVGSPACGDLPLIEIRVSSGLALVDDPFLTSLMMREKSPFPFAFIIFRRMVSYGELSVEVVVLVSLWMRRRDIFWKRVGHSK